jgi:hypothetical protein
MGRMKDELDARSLIGRPADEAREIAERYGYAVQVVPRNRPGVTLDLRPGRIRLITEGTLVTDAWFG